jgi:hypothetical protein
MGTADTQFVTLADVPYVSDGLVPICGYKRTRVSLPFRVTEPGSTIRNRATAGSSCSRGGGGRMAEAELAPAHARDGAAIVADLVRLLMRLGFTALVAFPDRLHASN